MKILQPIKTSMTASIDIETVRIEDNFKDLSEGYKSAWKYKNKQDGVIPNDTELSILWAKNASLYAEFSKVCAVSLAFMHKDKLICKEFYGKNEKNLLRVLGSTLNNMIANNKEWRLAGHASKFFDYPFLGKRFIINNLDIPIIIDSTALKPWEQSNLCTNEIWKLGGTGAGSSLQALCNVLEVPVSKVDLVGDEVGAAFYNNELERIGRYCSLDTIATYNVLRKLKKESTFTFEEVEYIKAYTDDATEIPEEKIVPFLQRLYLSKNFNNEAKKEIEGLLKNKEITDVDKTNLKDILLSVYFEKRDKIADKKVKTQEIEEFIKNL